MNGLHEHRLSPDAGNPREIVFSSLWKREQDWGDLVDQLLSVPCGMDDPEKKIYDPGFGYYKRPLGDTQDRDRAVAATIIQWLGSPVGFSFLSEALGECGYRLVPKETKP